MRPPLSKEQDDLFRRAIESWATASRLLGIRVTTPCSTRLGEISVDCLAFLPDFGSPKGMVVGTLFRPYMETDNTLEDFAKARGMFYSCLSLPDFADFDKRKHKEMLLDWGYFGSPDKRPNWFETESSS